MPPTGVDREDLGESKGTQLGDASLPFLSARITPLLILKWGLSLSYAKHDCNPDDSRAPTLHLNPLCWSVCARGDCHPLSTRWGQPSLAR